MNVRIQTTASGRKTIIGPSFTSKIGLPLIALIPFSFFLLLPPIGPLALFGIIILLYIIASATTINVDEDFMLIKNSIFSKVVKINIKDITKIERPMKIGFIYGNTPVMRSDIELTISDGRHFYIGTGSLVEKDIQELLRVIKEYSNGEIIFDEQTQKNIQGKSDASKVFIKLILAILLVGVIYSVYYSIQNFVFN